MILTGRPIHAQEALAIGLANEVVPKGESLNRALELAHQIASFPQRCMLNDRKAVYAGLGCSLEKGLRIEAQLGSEVIHSGEPYSGARSFQKGKGRGGQFE